MNAFLLLSTLNLSLGGLVFLLGFLFLRERLSLREGFGGVLMLAGILWHQWLSARPGERAEPR